jgi:hypothetical protein
MSLSFSGYQTQSVRFQQDLEASTGEVLGATARQTISELPIPAVARMVELGNAQMTGQRVDAESARQRIVDAGLEGRLTVGSEGTTSEALDILIERKRAEIKRQEVLSRSPGGFAMGTAQLGTAFAASLLDPLNVGLAFVPVVGEARYLKYLANARGVLGRTAVRVGVGAAEGAAGAALVEPLIYAAKTQEQADYDFTDSLLNVAFGTVFGGGLHAVAGGIGDAARALRPSVAPNTTAARIDAMTPAEREAPLRTAVAQAIEGRQVDVEAVMPRMPAEERLIATQVSEMLSRHEERLRAITEGPEARAVAMLGTDDTEVRLARATAGRDADAAILRESVEAQIEAEARRLASSDNANAYAIARSRERGLPDTVFDRWRKRAEETVGERRRAAEQRVEDANALIASMRETVDRRNRVRAAEADLDQLRYARDSAESVDDLVSALPTDQQGGFLRRLELGRTTGDIRPRGARLIDDESPPIGPAELRTIAERQASPESDVTADVRASMAAEQQLSESLPATDAIAEQEQLITDQLAELKDAARIADIDLTDELTAVDELIAQAESYGKAARAAALCGLGH